MVTQRIIALFILVIPGGLSIYGWTLMRDAIFNALAGEGLAWFPFIGGFLLFFSGLIFIGGFILRHDAKRNYVQPMIQKILRRKKK
ncbi:DUF2627 domain-containing protein [Mechercharimyces sp. CAU 1602]|uniref:DUF2627 domain-containing protein n=1 Tax=Mechercharimyces sp. CAU 1602 TaxID=2973933 RepID=UPI002161EAA4|nr:DUF2627 domain-containing protein [Mechercharimyces sp. CAU 1602]MCS1350801.1 DUF2627 domain-containing protein [Mechercharimyces sp. CAU 1602]